MIGKLITPLEEIAESEVRLITGIPPTGVLRIVRYGEGEYNIGTVSHQPLWVEIKGKNNPKYRIAFANFFYMFASELTLVGREKVILLRIWRDGYELQEHVEDRDTRNDISQKIEQRVPFEMYWNRINGNLTSVSTSGFYYSSCTICNEIERGFLEIQGINHGQRDIYRTENFIVKPSLGPLVEGHMCIFTEEHYQNIGDAPAVMHPELEELMRKVEHTLQRVYHSPALFFEHGPAPGNRAGCCVDHAHLHAMPIEGRLREWIPKEAREITSFDALSELYAHQIPYLFFQENDRKRYVIELSDPIISQYIRRVIAKHKGLPQLDWRQDLNLPCVFATYNKMKRAMSI